VASDYILFDAALRDRFVQFAMDRGIPFTLRPDAMGGDVVELPDDLADDIEEAVEAKYESLMEEQRALVEASEGESARNVVGVAITRRDGRPGVVRIPAEIARRLMQHFSTEEIHAFVAAIAEGVENPVEGPLCRNG
jgi:hypothetical protein